MEFVISIALMFGIMYFLLIRPQKKQQEKVQDMLDNLETGDSVVTIGGMHGVIDEINPEEKTIVIDCEGIYLTFERRSISKVVSKASETSSSDTESTEDIIVEASDEDQAEDSEE